jgi:23S rRNA pseudouridine2605 synthase
VREPALRALRQGVELEDGRTAPARVKRLAPDRIELVIHEGRKRQVRRMLDAVGHPVAALQRVAFGTLTLGSLAEGQSRRLSEAEIERLRRAASGAATQTAIRGALRRR